MSSVASLARPMVPSRAGAPLLDVRGLVKRFPVERGFMAAHGEVHAVEGVDL